MGSCLVHQRKFGNLSIEISNNGYDFTQSGLRVSVNSQNKFQIHPTIGSSLGENIVTVKGLSFVDHVSFNGTARRIERTLDGINVVTVPKSKSFGIVPVNAIFSDSISMNGRTFYEYCKPMTITKIKPSMIPSTGGTQIQILDMISIDEEDMYIKIGERILKSKVEGTRIYIKKARLTSGGNYIAFAFTESCLHIQNLFPIVVYDNPKLDELFPSQLLQAQNHIVTGRGINFMQTKHLSCRIGDKKQIAEWMSSSLFTCVAPATKPGN
eukprot:468226-Hanusia_phi.AAC.1